MKKNILLVKCTAFFLCSALLLAHKQSAAQSVCGPVVETFDQAGGSTAGFTGDFQFGSEAANGLLLKNKVVASGVYSITTPTYQLPAAASYIGFGFSLSGTERIARAEVVVTYLSTLTNEMTKVFLGQFVPTYFPGESTAEICRAAQLTDLPGFPAGGQYRLRIELTANTGGGAIGETINFNDFRTNGTVAAIPLPVSFLSLDAKKLSGHVQLAWKVAGEENVAYYDVEKSSDGSHFSAIGRVSRSGKDSYAFTDESNNPLSYYRIKNVDNDGRFRYSAIARLTGSASEIVLKAYPQPVRNNLTLQHPASEGKAAIRLSTADGRTLRLLTLVSGSNQTTVDMTGLQSGLYLLRFEDGKGSVQTLKVVKQ